MGVVSQRDTKEVKKLADRVHAERGGATASAESCIAATNLERGPDVLLLCSAKCSFSTRRQRRRPSTMSSRSWSTFGTCRSRSVTTFHSQRTRCVAPPQN